MFAAKKCVAYSFRIILFVLCIALAMTVQTASALSLATASSASLSTPTVIETRISASSGEVPKRIEIQIIASGSVYGTRIETEQGQILYGEESFRRNSDDTTTYSLKYTFTNRYQGMLYIFLKTQDGKWIKSNTDFNVDYSSAKAKNSSTVPYAPTASPVPTPAELSVTDSTAFMATASSVYRLKYNREYTVGADMAVDGKLQTAWNEGADGAGIGEWIQLTPYDGRRYTYNGFKIANGFQYHTYHKGDRWAKNNRVSALAVYADGNNYIGTYTIPDRYDGYDTIYFNSPVTCYSLRFQIVSVWKGNQFTDTCISEIRPF